MLDKLRLEKNIYDPLVQRELISLLDAGEKLKDVISAIIWIHEETRAKQFGLWSRLNMRAATRFDWTDPRLADGVPIYSRTWEDLSKINHKSHTPFDRSIMNNKTSFFVGKPVKVVHDENQELIEMINEEFKINKKQFELAQSAVDQGAGYLLLYSPAGVNEVYIARKQSYHCVVLYDQDTEKAKYGLIYTRLLGTELTEVKGSFYTEKEEIQFDGSMDNIKTSNPTTHLFNGVPLIEFANNTERIGDVELTIGLQDLFDVMDSDFLSELSQLRLAYMLLKNMGLDLDQETMDKLKQAGVFVTDEENASIEFVEKNINYQAIEYAKQDLKARIYEQSNSYDPNSLGGGAGDITAFQIKMKLKPLEDSTKETEMSFKASLMETYRLIGEYYSTYNRSKSFDSSKIKIHYQRNYPQNIIEDIKQSKEAGYEIAQDILAELMPFEINQERNKTLLMEELSDMPDLKDESTDTEISDIDGQDLDIEVDKDIVLNGAQIKSALDIVKSVKLNEITREEGLNMIEFFFNIPRDKAERVLSGV